MTEAVVSALLGGIAGFLTSLFFWRKSQRKDRPRLYIKVREIDQKDGSAGFEVENEGDTHALNIKFDGYPFPDAPTDLAPKARFYLEMLGLEESKYHTVGYSDVWGTQYEARWHIAGPTKFELAEGDSLYDYAQADRLYEFQGGGLILKVRNFFRKNHEL